MEKKKKGFIHETGVSDHSTGRAISNYIDKKAGWEGGYKNSIIYS